MSEPIFNFKAGTQPILISCPHVGTVVPDHIAQRFTPAGITIADTDWHVDKLYHDSAEKLDLSILTATHSRYVIDLNRPSDNAELYAGANNTELCPTSTFDQAPIYTADTPDDADVADRVARYWRPYHDKLASVMADMVSEHGIAVLVEGHSIRSVVPRFFDGVLPELNLGTASDESADGELAARVMDGFQVSGFTSVQNGRFKGGYITRTYGNPSKNTHALQLEMTQSCYMDEIPPFGFRADLAAKVQPAVHAMLETVLTWVNETKA